MPAWILILILCPLLPTLVAAPRASAQAIPRPADERPALEPFEEPARPRLELPPVPEAAERGDALASGLTIEVREVRVEGSSVFSSEELAQQTGPWVGRRLDTAEIGDLVDAVTELYVANGYVSSGAMLPDQDVENGVLRIQVIEARLAQVVVEGNRWYRTRTLQARLHRAVPFPVHVGLLEEQLQLLLQEPDIQRVAGELHPGLRRGEDVLALRIEEEQPFRLRASFANDQPPGIGSVRGSLQVEDLNLLGFGDALQGWFDFTDGLETQEVRYELPFTSLGTALGLRFRHTDSDVVESPFDAADIESETWTAGIGLSQPLIRTPRMQLSAGLTGEWRRSTSYVGGTRFSFVPGPERGRADVSLLRFTQDFSWRSRRDVLAMRSTLTWGLDVLGATDQPGNIPDGRFVAWLAQAQWAHRFPERLWGTQLVLRGDLQLASDTLLSLERIAVGGMRTVRGYRENLLVRDNAVISSAELRIPLLRGLLGDDVLELAPFVDFAYAWDDQRHLSGPSFPGDAELSSRALETLSSVGVGLRYGWGDRLQLEAYWGGRLRSVERSSSNIQDNGAHLSLTLRAF